MEKGLADLPARVQAYLEDLETLLAQDQVERGKGEFSGVHRISVEVPLAA